MRVRASMMSVLWTEASSVREVRASEQLRGLWLDAESSSNNNDGLLSIGLVGRDRSGC